ncbi:MAG: dTMP kinase [Pseudobdellovibrionaceae bacterium]
MAKQGLFITFEGGEGAGKTTQCRRIKSALEERGFEVVLTREPGGVPEAEKIRDLLVQREGGNWTPMAECLLFFAARQMHTEKLIKPALDEGKVVICDRYTDSTVAYQGYGHGFDRTTIYQIEKLTLGDFRPDLTLLLDLPVEEGLTRSLKQKDAAGGRENTEDRFEKLKTEFHERLRRGFLTIAKENSGRCVVVDAVQDVDHVFSQVRGAVFARLEAVHAL